MVSKKPKIGWRGDLSRSRTLRHPSVQLGAARRHFGEARRRECYLNLGDLVPEADKIKATELEAREHRELQFRPRIGAYVSEPSWSVIQRFEDMPQDQHVFFVTCPSICGGLKESAGKTCPKDPALSVQLQAFLVSPFLLRSNLALFNLTL